MVNTEINIVKYQISEIENKNTSEDKRAKGINKTE